MPILNDENILIVFRYYNGEYIRKIRTVATFFLVFFFLSDFSFAQSATENKRVIGWVEYVTILPNNVKIKAKLDTGAKHSSLNASNIIEFKRGDKEFVRFDLTNWKGRRKTIEANIVRVAKIKRHKMEPQRRPVVRIRLCIENVQKEVDVNLIDRSNFNYQLLIGRSYLKGDFVVDPSKTFTVKTDCRKVLVNE
jgi:hypothetical protein